MRVHINLMLVWQEFDKIMNELSVWYNKFATSNTFQISSEIYFHVCWLTEAYNTGVFYYTFRQDCTPILYDHTENYARLWVVYLYTRTHRISAYIWIGSLQCWMKLRSQSSTCTVFHSCMHSIKLSVLR